MNSIFTKLVIPDRLAAGPYVIATFQDGLSWRLKLTSVVYKSFAKDGCSPPLRFEVSKLDFKSYVKKNLQLFRLHCLKCSLLFDIGKIMSMKNIN